MWFWLMQAECRNILALGKEWYILWEGGYCDDFETQIKWGPWHPFLPPTPRPLPLRFITYQPNWLTPMKCFDGKLCLSRAIKEEPHVKDTNYTQRLRHLLSDNIMVLLTRHNRRNLRQWQLIMSSRRLTSRKFRMWPNNGMTSTKGTKSLHLDDCKRQLIFHYAYRVESGGE